MFSGSLAAAAGVTSQAGSTSSLTSAADAAGPSGAVAAAAGGASAGQVSAANRFAAPRRTGVRSRYVDTMNAAGGGGGGGGIASGGGGVGLAALVPKPSFAPPPGGVGSGHELSLSRFPT